MFSRRYRSKRLMGYSHSYFSSLKMEAAGSSETVVPLLCTARFRIHYDFICQANLRNTVMTPHVTFCCETKYSSYGSVCSIYSTVYCIKVR
jgi:hypothetical protein